MGRIKKCPRYLTDITGQAPLSLVEVEGRGSNSEKLKNEVFLTYERVIGS